MATFTKRVQTVLTEQEYENLSRLSEAEGKPISVLVREAVEKVYFQGMARERRRAALKSLLELKAPVRDWPDMEQEIAGSATEG